MVERCSNQLWWQIGSEIAVVAVIGVFWPWNNAIAQIVPDSTLGAERSVVAPNTFIRGVLSDRIDGGAMRGANLFHSFLEFNVREGRGAYFSNPTGVETIFSRVTGQNASAIMGRLGVLGTANLFLLNPNGIIFGPNARLDVAGSFTASTAHSLNFSDGTSYSATRPGAPPLLRVKVPLGVQFGPGQGDITNAGNLAVNAGQTLTLHGGTVRSTGSLIAPGGTVQVLGDRVALLDNARIDVSGETGGGTVLIGGDYRGQGPVPNALRTYVGPNVTINADARTSGDGGKIIIWSDESTRSYGKFTARGGALVGNGGLIETSSKGFLDTSRIQVDASAVNGLSGTWLIDPRNIIIQDGGVTNGTFDDEGRFTPGGDDSILTTADIVTQLNNRTNVMIATGTAGNQPGDIRVEGAIAKTTSGVATLTLQAANDITINAPITSIPEGALNLELNGDSDRNGSGIVQISQPITTPGGNIILKTADTIPTTGASAVRINNNALLDTRNSSGSLDQSGSIQVTTGLFEMTDGAQITTSTRGRANAGSITIQANTVSLDGGGTIIFNNVEAGGVGNGGITTITTDSLTLTNGAQLQALVRGQGDPGKIIVRAPGGIVRLDGTSRGSDGITRSSAIFTSRQLGSIKGASDIDGSIEITTSIFEMLNGARLFASTSGRGDAGIIDIKANTVTLTGIPRLTLDNPNNTTIFNNVEAGGIGNGGKIEITTNSLTLRNGAQLQALVGESEGGRPAGQGNAGSIFVKAPNGTVRLDGTSFNLRGRAVPSAILTNIEEGAAGNGGIIDITAGFLTLRNGAQLQALVRGSGDGRPAGQGNAGSIFVKAPNGTVQLEGTGFSGLPSAIFTSLGEGTSGLKGESGTGGLISINTDIFKMTKGADLSASTRGLGDAGLIDIQAKEVSLDGGGTTIFNNVEAGGIGNGGLTTITTGSLTLTNGAQLQALVRGADKVNGIPPGRGNAGTIDVKASRNIILDGTSGGSPGRGFPSAIFTSLEEGASGAGGDIRITANLLSLRNGATLSVRTFGEGDGGNINITVLGQLLQLQNNALISAEARRGSNGGNIELNVRSGFVLANLLENSDIIARAVGGGDGGRIQINTFAIFGLEKRDRLTPLSDITASSDVGTDGIIILNTLGIDPSRGFLQLPEDLGDSSRLIAQACPVGGQRAASRFVVTGRGGLPPTPSSSLSSDTLQGNPGTIAPSAASPAPVAMVEARGVDFGPNGEIVFTANPSTVTPYSPWQKFVGCDEQ